MLDLAKSDFSAFPWKAAFSGQVFIFCIGVFLFSPNLVFFWVYATNWRRDNKLAAYFPDTTVFFLDTKALFANPCSIWHVSQGRVLKGNAVLDEHD